MTSRGSAGVRVLMPSIVDPAISRSGAGTVTRNLIRLLEAPPLSAAVECVSIPSFTNASHRVHQGIAVARSLVSPLPAKALYTWSRSLEKRIASLVQQGTFDLVIINGSDLLWIVPLLPPGIPRLLIAHNIEAALFASQVGYVSGKFKVLRPMLARELRRMEEFETQGIRDVANVVFLSSVDEADASASIAALNTILIPPMFGDVSESIPARTGDTLELGFLGNLHWWPNREALDWFLRFVLPQVNRPVLLHVFGDGRVSVNDPRVVLHGPVADVQRVWGKCDLMIVPTHSGGGVSIKLAEALFHGMPCLSTRFAIRGLTLPVHPALTIRDDAAEWVQYINSVEVFEVRKLRGSSEVSRTFSLESHRERLQQYVRDVIEREKTRGAGGAVARELAAESL